MSKSKKLGVFVPLVKVDEDQRLVYGRITAQEQDQSGETMDYATSVPNFQKWSSMIEEASGGLSKGNLRVMHGLKVGGKLTDISYNDEDQSIEVCAKVTDDAEWNNVLEGCYTGFSVGGRYEKKWAETINGQTIKKYTADPNEVSLVDNPCVKSATFQLIKADGSIEDRSLGKVTADTETNMFKTTTEPKNDEVVAKATKLAFQKADGSTWMDHIHDARELLIKEASSNDAAITEITDEGEAAAEEGVEDTENAGANPDTDEENSDNQSEEEKKKLADAKKAAGADVAGRLKQKWLTSDGRAFSKKADAAFHEEELVKAATMTDLDRLRERLAKATENPTIIEVPLEKSFTRMGDVFDALTKPFVDGKPVLEKGLYTVSSFARALWDMGNIALAIKREGSDESSGEAGDPEDMKSWMVICESMTGLGEVLKEYLDCQITELMAGINDDELASIYDYYYCAAQANSDDVLSKDACAVIEQVRDASREKRQVLIKAFGGMTDPVVAPVVDNDLQKRFDRLESENTDLKKIATDAIEQVEGLAKRIQAVEDTPMPRAPNPQNVALRDGDVPLQAFGKSFGSETSLREHLHDMIATQGPDAVALAMIKASHAGGGRLLTANPR